MYYYLHRWYDPSIGRFISPDPKQGKLSNPQTLNLYVYVLDRPTSLSDPTGLDDCGWNPLSWGGCVSNGAQATSNWWNSQDQQTKTAIILAVATVAIVATAGIAAPAVLPLVATGIAVGAGTSAASYAVATTASGGSITAKGLLTSVAIGGFFGAVSLGTYGTVAGVAASAGLGGAASFVLGTLASFGVTAFTQGMVGTTLGTQLGVPNGVQSLIAHDTQTVGQIGSLSNYGSPVCQAGVAAGALMGAAGILLLDASAHVIGSSDDWRVNAAGFALLGVGMSLPVAGLLYANSQC